MAKADVENVCHSHTHAYDDFLIYQIFACTLCLERGECLADVEIYLSFYAAHPCFRLR